MAQTLMSLKNVQKRFQVAGGGELSVLEGVNLELREGEIVALLGKSGSGKSTLLRIIAGLSPTSSGEVLYRDQPVHGALRGVAMVFQSFALFPWLTVQQNVEIGMEAQGVPAEVRRVRAEAAIEMIGLDGFASALPRELSGGMRQRVGIARAMVVNPDILLMDEAFSALDVLTGETLRDDMLELWLGGKLATRSIVLVSHNIEETVMMADRILILASDPGKIKFELPVTLPHPRNKNSVEVRRLVDHVYGLMTASRVTQHLLTTTQAQPIIALRLPSADIGRIEGLIEVLAQAPFLGRADLPQLAEEVGLSDDDLFPPLEAMDLLGFARLDGGDVTLTPAGHDYARADQHTRQLRFGEQLLQHVPLVAHIRAALDENDDHEAYSDDFLDVLTVVLKDNEAERVLTVAIDWGRYGGVFEYNMKQGKLTLDEDDIDENNA